MYRKCIHKFPPCYAMKYSTKFWNVISGTKPCCKKCIALFCNYILSIIQAPTSATPYTLPITSNQKLLTILVTRSILNCLCWCSAFLLYTANSCCYIIIFLMYLKELPVLMFWFSTVYCKFLLLYKFFFHVPVTKNYSLFWLHVIY